MKGIMQKGNISSTYQLLKSDSEGLEGINSTEADEESVQEEDEAIEKSSMWQAWANLMSDIEGTGLLGLPYVIAQSGLVAIAALLFVPFIAFYTGVILIDCLYDTNNAGERVRARSNYKELGAACSPRFGAAVVTTVQLIDLLLLASLYLVLAASLASGIFSGSPLSEKVWMIIAAAIGLPTIFVKSLSQVAWLSLLSVIALFVAVIVVIGYGFAHYSTWVPRGILVWDLDSVPVSLAVIIFSYLCHPILPGVEASMKKRSHFRRMLALVYLSVAMLKLVFAVCAYFSFSSNIHDVIVNSLPMGIIRLVVNSFFLLNVLFSYPFRVITIVQTFEGSVSADSFPFKIPDLVWFLVIRVVANFLTLLPAIAIPHFALFMAFIGSLTGGLDCFVLPGVFHLALKTKELKMYECTLYVAVIVFGIVASILGLLYTGKELFGKLA